MVGTPAEERCWEKDAEDGTARKYDTPKRRFMDAMREDMAGAEVTEEDAKGRTEWRLNIRCGDR